MLVKGVQKEFRIAKTLATAIIMSGNKEMCIHMELQGNGLITNTFASLYVHIIRTYKYLHVVAAMLSFYCIIFI